MFDYMYTTLNKDQQNHYIDYYGYSAPPQAYFYNFNCLMDYSTLHYPGAYNECYESSLLNSSSLSYPGSQEPLSTCQNGADFEEKELNNLYMTAKVSKPSKPTRKNSNKGLVRNKWLGFKQEEVLKLEIENNSLQEQINLLKDEIINLKMLLASSHHCNI